MAIRDSFNGGSKAIAAVADTASVTVVLTANDIPASAPGASLGEILLTLTGAATATNDLTFAMLTRIRVKANGSTIWDLTYAQLQTYLETFTPVNLAPSIQALEGTVSTAGASPYQLSLPFWILDAGRPDDMAAGAFPMGNTPTIELTFTNSLGGGTASNAMTLGFGWKTSDVAPAVVPYLIASQMNIAAGATNGTYPVTSVNPVRAIGMNIKGLKRLRYVAGSTELTNLSARTALESAAALAGSLVTQSMALWSPLTANISGGGRDQGGGFLLKKFDGMTVAPPGSRVEIDTNATDWAGVTNECLLFTISPQPPVDGVRRSRAA